jgi:hypothetical protein
MEPPSESVDIGNGTHGSMGDVTWRGVLRPQATQ